MLAAIITGGVCGALVVLTYIWLYYEIEQLGGTQWWFYPITPSMVPCWVAYTTTTVAAYGAIVYWMATEVPNDPTIWWVATGFNISAALWMPAGAADWTYKRRFQLSGATVVSTAIMSVIWFYVAHTHSPGLYYIPLTALVFHHVVVDAIWWGGTRALYPPPSDGPADLLM